MSTMVPGRDGQPLLVGVLMAALLKAKAEVAKGDGFLHVETVEPCYDGDGNYEPYFRVRLPSGAYLVSVSALEE